MVLKGFKLHQIAPISRWCGTKFFLHTRLKNYTILQKLCRITQSGNAVRQHQCGKQARAEWPDCARCILPNIYKSCQTTNNTAEIRQNICTFCSVNDLPNNGSNTNCVT